MQVLQWVNSSAGSRNTARGRFSGSVEGGAARLLCVTAHPEDATLAFGGVIARYAAAGVETHLITATLGDLGWYRDMDDEYPGVEDLIRVRRVEAGRAASALGVHKAVYLGYPDARLDEMDRTDVVGRIRREIRRVRPQVVLTFCRDLVFGHPDQNALSSHCDEAVRTAAEAAVEVDGYPPHRVSRYYHLVWSPAAVSRYQAAFGICDDALLLPSTVNEERPYVTSVDASDYWRSVATALECHSSQFRGYKGLRSLPASVQRRLWQAVELEQMAGCGGVAWAPRDDIFAGLGVAAWR